MSLLSARITFEQIAQFNAQYARCIDDDRLEAWPDFFRTACRYSITTAQNLADGLPAGIIHADSRAMLVDRVSALREANIYERHTYRHILGMPLIIGDEGEGVRCETPFLVVRIMADGPSDVFATGRYLDVFSREADAIKITERIVACDSSRIDTLLALPL